MVSNRVHRGHFGPLYSCHVRPGFKKSMENTEVELAVVGSNRYIADYESWNDDIVACGSIRPA